MAEDVRRKLGREVRRHRLAAGLTQAELSNLMGVDRAYVSGLELGQRNATVLTIWSVAEALGIGVGNFFEEKPRKKAR